MILLVAHSREGRLLPESLQAITAARSLSEAFGAPLRAVLLGADTVRVAQELTQFVPHVYVASHAKLARFCSEPWTAVVCQVARASGAEAVVIPGVRSGLSYAPRVAVRLGMPLMDEVVELRRVGRDLSARRAAFLARVNQWVATQGLSSVITTKVDAFPEALSTGVGKVEAVEPRLRPEDMRVVLNPGFDAREDPISRTGARPNQGGGLRTIVAGGRGVGGSEGFRRFVEPLARALAGAVGATRPPVDEGWRPFVDQIGQTGRTVAPDLYVALGISGAAQHVCGITHSRVVVAINRDAGAPIFRHSDYGVVGDLEEVVPSLLRVIQAAGSPFRSEELTEAPALDGGTEP
jgi:electron transfer flavoprotein alpha subunit